MGWPKSPDLNFSWTKEITFFQAEIPQFPGVPALNPLSQLQAGNTGELWFGNTEMYDCVLTLLEQFLCVVGQRCTVSLPLFKNDVRLKGTWGHVLPPLMSFEFLLCGNILFL